MNLVHLHLILNHLPVVGMLIAAATLGFGIFLKSGSAHRVGLWLVAVAAVLALPAYLTGEPAEDAAENFPGVSEALIEPHEDAAGVALALSLAAGLVAVPAALMLRANCPLAAKATWLAFALAVAASGTMAYTAALGGQIRHPEIR